MFIQIILLLGFSLYTSEGGRFNVFKVNLKMPTSRITMRDLKQNIDSLNSPLPNLTTRLETVENKTVNDALSCQGMTTNYDNLKQEMANLQIETMKEDKALKETIASLTSSQNQLKSKLGELATSVLLKPGSCAEIQACGEKLDQEYWIYPKLLGGKRLKVYCNGMTGNDTAEYITLPQKNNGEYPNIRNIDCTGVDDHLDGSTTGSYWYKKIRFHPEIMVVNREDRTFTEGKGVTYEYGQASDCYTPLQANVNTCGPKGFFNINTSGTGLIVSPSIVWKPYGNRPYQSVVRENSNAVVKLRCGGACGGCRPMGDFKLILNPKEVLAMTSAKEVKCSRG